MDVKTRTAAKREARRRRTAAGTAQTGCRADRPDRHRAAAQPLCLSPLNKTALAEFQDQPARLLVVVDFPGAVLRHAVRRIRRQRQAALRQLRRQIVFPGALHLSGNHIRRRLRNRRGLSRPLSAKADRRQGRPHDLAADPLFLLDAQSRSADAGAVAADLDADRGAMQIRGRAQRPEKLQRSRIQLARHRRPGPRRAGAADLRFPHLGAVRADPDHLLLDHRRRRRRRAGLFRRLDRSPVPALHRNLDIGAGALSAA